MKHLVFCGHPLSDFTVITAVNADPAEQLAAAELKKYLERAAEVSIFSATDDRYFPCELIVGHTARDFSELQEIRAGLGTEGIVILAQENRIFFSGATPRGTLYSVYSFLEDVVGWRFYTKDIEVLEGTDPVSVPTGMKKIFRPKLEYRDLFWYDAFDPGFSAKRRINGMVGRDLHAFGGGISYAGFVHTLPYLAETSAADGDQPCLTDPEIYRTVMKNIRKTLKNKPDANILSVSQNDSPYDRLGCTCGSCTELDERERSPAGSLLTFVNRIARELRDDYPDLAIDTLAYRYTRHPPKNLHAEPNVIVRLCSIECDFARPYWKNADLSFAEDVRDWSKKCDRLYIWDYTTNFTYYLTPFPNLHVLPENIRFLVHYGVKGIFEQGNYQTKSGEFGDLRAYLLSVLLWNPDLTDEEYEEHLNGFLAACYGGGWKELRSYIALTEAAVANTEMHIYGPTYRIFRDWELKNNSIALWKSALVKCGKEHRAFTEQASIQLIYALTKLAKEQKMPYDPGQLFSLLRTYEIPGISEAMGTFETSKQLGQLL